jgi:hypothetical protein
MLTDKPVWRGKEGSDKTYAFITGTANLTCLVTAEPKPKFEWFKSKKLLVAQQNATIFEGELNSTLQVYLYSSLIVVGLIWVHKSHFRFPLFYILVVSSNYM